MLKSHQPTFPRTHPPPVSLFFAAFVLATALSGGILEWLTSEVCDWEFIQKSGGIRVAQPVVRDGERLLPVTYDISGLSEVTRKPTSINSGLVVSKVEAVHVRDVIVIRVIRQVADKAKQAGPDHFAKITQIESGTYAVFYGNAGNEETYLGEVRIE